MVGRGAAQAAIDRRRLGAVVGVGLAGRAFAKAKAGRGEKAADCRGLAELAEEDRHVRFLDREVPYWTSSWEVTTVAIV